MSVPVEDVLAAIAALRRAVRSSRDPRGQARLVHAWRRLLAALGPSVPKLAATRALGISLTALDRWIERGLVPVVRSPEHSRLRPETGPLLELLEEVERLREDGHTGRVVEAALRHLRRRPYGEGRWIVSAELAALPRPNVPAAELRATALATTPTERLETVAELSETATTLAALGRAS